MKTFQKIFDSELDKLMSIKTLIRKTLKAKLNVSDVEIETLTNKFVELIENNDDDTATFEINDETDRKIELTDDDIEKVGKEITDNFERAYPKVIKETSNHVLKIIDRDSPSTLKLHREDREGFENRLKDIWKKAFDVFESFLLLVNDSGREFNDEYRPDAIIENDVVFDTLIRLHVRACQIGNEIFTLIRTGYADGAHARWRTLHEVTVIAIFISKHGKSVAEKYRLHEIIESRKAAIQYQKYCGSLGYKPYSKKKLDQFEKHYNELIKIHGANFKEEYGWASSVLHSSPKYKPTFSDIEKDVGLEHFRPYYKMASHNTHANPKGIMFKLGMIETNSISAGATNTGFTDPAHQTAISLLQITTTLLLTKPNIDVLIRFEVLKKLEKRVGTEFLKIQKQIEKKEIELTKADFK